MTGEVLPGMVFTIVAAATGHPHVVITCLGHGEANSTLFLRTFCWPASSRTEQDILTVKVPITVGDWTFNGWTQVG